MQVIRVINKFRRILSSHQKIRIVELTILMIVGGFLEMLSVSLILPFMEAVRDPDAIMSKWYARMICTIFDINSSTTFLVAMSFLLAIIYILKNVYLILENNFQYKFVYGNMFSLQSQLLKNYLHRPYEYYLGVDSGEIIRIVNNDTVNVFQLLITLLSFLTEFIVTVILSITVFMIAPFITLCMAGILLLLVLVINVVLKPILRRAGLQNQRSNAGMNKWLIQSIQGIKEIIVMRRESYFLKNYDDCGSERVVSLRKQNIFGSLPRFLIEAVSMSSMFAVVGVMIYKGDTLESMIPALTAVAMAALRLLPAVNRMSVSLTGISFNEPMLDKLIENLKNMNENNKASLSQTPTSNKDRLNHLISGFGDSISLENISYTYPMGEKKILDKASFLIHAGESIGLVGSTGAGKTTVVDIVLGLLTPQEGRVIIDGIDIREDMSGWRNQVGYIPQMIFMLDDSIRSNVAFGIPEDEISDEMIWQALRDASMDKFVQSLPDKLQTQIGERGVRLSGGQRQRIGIARALYLNPSVLIFDEATSALDNETERDIMESINHLHGKKTMIIIAHRLSTIESCDHIYKVEDGKILIER